MKDGSTPSATPLVPPEPDVVPAAPPGTGYRIPSKRRRRRWLMAFLVVWTLVAVGVGLAWYQYGRLSHELRVSNGRVAGPLKRALTPAPAGAPRQTTLVAGMDSNGHLAGAVILTRIDSARHAVEILTVPSTVLLGGSQRLGDVVRSQGVPGVIGLLEHDLGLPVNHVLLMQLPQAGSIVRSLGGIAIANPAPVPYDVSGSRGVFPAGRVALTGRTVQWYLEPNERPVTIASDVRQAAVIRGVTDKLVHLTTPSAITEVGHTISRNFTTDLSPDPVLALVAGRLRAHRLVDCRLGAGADLTRGSGLPAVAGFETAAPGAACSAVPLQTALPGAGVAATIIATIVTHGGSHALYWLVVATIAIWGIAACAWVLMLPAVRGVRRLPRRSLPPRGSRRPHVSLPHVRLPERPPPSQGRLRRRRRIAVTGLRVLSVPMSIGLGMLIAYLLY
jgi:anionic cell wall polymer biosynthesis LytR-Cps2A-Psr (LCP) family protein